MKKNLPRVMLTAIGSGSGKTMITCGLLQALINRELKVASFKCGPDYIDPMFHSRVIGAKSRNLDSYFLEDETLKYVFAKTAKSMDISVIEGVMGYYDGLSGLSTKASSYDIARITDTPVILIINAKGMSGSILALIKGFLEYVEDSKIAGVILNHMTSMYYPIIKKEIEEKLPIRVLGYVETLPEMKIESRHLGLVSPDEVVHFREDLEHLAEVFEKSLDIDAILEIAYNAKELKFKEPKIPRIKDKVRIGIASDEAFTFYYEDNFDLLRQMGAELTFFSPLKDEKLPEECDGIWLGGGYPERFAKELSRNVTMRDSIQTAIRKGMPCIAECGGFLYLHNELEDESGKSYKMVSVIDAKAYKTERLQRFGYVDVKTNKTSILGEAFIHFPAHEYHYWDSENPGNDCTANKRGRDREYPCIHCNGNLFAGFPHLYLYGNIEMAYQFLVACATFKDEIK